MKSTIKSFCIAFSMFSKIPMPQFEWKEKEMRHMVVFFPFVGVVIGIITYGWYFLCKSFEINNLCFSLVGAAIPLIITGGIHIDGYMDTMDALHSYQDKDRKLEILKDPHIGAFSVIYLLIYYLFYIAAYSMVDNSTSIILLGLGFWLSRVLSGIGILTFPCAKKDGLMYLFATQTEQKIVKGILYFQGILCTAILLYVSPIVGTIMLVASILTFCFYGWKSKKEFGGITGDTSGWFTTLCEGVIIIIIALGSI